jgi:hypothetical protein
VQLRKPHPRPLLRDVPGRRGEPDFAKGYDGQGVIGALVIGWRKLEKDSGGWVRCVSTDDAMITTWPPDHLALLPVGSLIVLLRPYWDIDRRLPITSPSYANAPAGEVAGAR